MNIPQQNNKCSFDNPVEQSLIYDNIFIWQEFELLTIRDGGCNYQLVLLNPHSSEQALTCMSSINFIGTSHLRKGLQNEVLQDQFLCGEMN